MTRARQSALSALALLIFGLAMAGVHLLLTGINEQFGWGFGVGAAVAAGGMGLIVKDFRNGSV